MTLLNYSDQRDLKKPKGKKLVEFQAQKEVNRREYTREFHKLKHELKKLSKEKERLKATQVS